MKQHVSFPFLLNGVYVYPMKVAADWQHAAEGRGGVNFPKKVDYCTFHDDLFVRQAAFTLV